MIMNLFVGKRTLVEGSTGCINCPIGTYSDFHRTLCKPCGRGTYSGIEGDPGSCYSCPKGHHQDETGQTSCKQCPVGTYQDEERQHHCKPCSLDGQIPVMGQTTCMGCQ